MTQKPEAYECSDWYEVWADESLHPPYLLLLMLKEKGRAGVMVIDPKEDNKVVFSAANYQDAELWLLEDEYTRVEGRMISDI